MLFKLISLRLKATFSNLGSGFKRNGKASCGIGFKIVIAVLLLYVAAVSLGLFGILFFTLAAPLNSMGLGSLYFSLAAVISFFLCVIGSVFAAKSQLFEAKDNELLMSLPIKPWHILGSRIASLLLTNYLYSAIVLLPAGVVWFWQIGAAFASVFSFIVGFVFIPFLALAVSCALGWVIAKISARLPGRSFVSVIVFVAFFVAYYSVYSKVGVYIQNIVANAPAVAAALAKFAYPAHCFGLAAADGRILMLLPCVLICAAPFVAVLAVLSKTYVKIMSAKKAAAPVRERAEKGEAKSQGAMAALIKKELVHYKASSAYLLNGGSGAVFMLVAAVALAVKRGSLDAALGTAVSPWVLVAAATSFCAAMVMFSAPSISLEAKTLWILKTMPVAPEKILLSKAAAHFIAAAPFAVISAIVGAAAFSLGAPETAACLLAPLSILALTASAGVAVNLRFPKFDWISEVYAIKQGAASLVSILIGWAAAIVQIAASAAGSLFGIGCAPSILVSVLTLAVSALIVRGYKKGGARRFTNL